MNWKSDHFAVSDVERRQRPCAAAEPQRQRRRPVVLAAGPVAADVAAVVAGRQRRLATTFGKMINQLLPFELSWRS